VVRSAPLALGSWQALPVPGYVEVGDQEMELHIADGHTGDGTAFFARWAGVLVVGDYISDFEIPMISAGGSLDAYRGTLARLAPLVEASAVVVPGHGSPHPRDTALRILDEDSAYLDALERGNERVTLPNGRDGARQREIHAANVAALGG
jgi:glyoxylase-like metal-dependent hydrolase (beta-lactamase superfamily II)